VDAVTPPTPDKELAVTEDVAWLRVDETSASGTVRRRAAELAERLGFTEGALGEISIVATELATNLVKYARDGVVVLRALRSDHAAGMAVVAFDKGPGLRDLGALFADGESSSGTLGIGLGAVRRLASSYDAHSVPGAGTVVSATFWQGEPAAEPAAGLARALDGEPECGDAYATRRTGRGLLLMLADGLGHGSLAARASTECVRVFRESELESPAALLTLMHKRISATRGAATAIGHLDVGARRLTYAGVGNIAGRVVSGRRTRGLVTMPGIVGHNLRAVQDMTYDVEPDAWVVMHSDGLTEKWELDRYPGLLTCSPLVVATTLLRDAAVHRDDASVLACPGQPR
jgi:anti-sigma regulatory factor (Ser/Thr protein kinase)